MCGFITTRAWSYGINLPLLASSNTPVYLPLGPQGDFWEAFVKQTQLSITNQSSAQSPPKPISQRKYVWNAIFSKSTSKSRNILKEQLNSSKLVQQNPHQYFIRIVLIVLVLYVLVSTDDGEEEEEEDETTMGSDGNGNIDDDDDDDSPQEDKKDKQVSLKFSRTVVLEHTVRSGRLIHTLVIELETLVCY